MLFVIKYYLPVFLIAFSICWLLIRFPWSRLQDKSGERSLHEGVIPRSGGLAILLAFVVGCAYLLPVLRGIITMPLITVVLLIGTISLLDDFFSLPLLLRLFFQFLIAGVIVFIGQLYFTFNGVLPLLWCKCLTVLGLIWMINLYNFMDGMDGFASGMAMIAFSTLALLGYVHADTRYAVLNLLLVMAVSGFWCFNFPPAKIFMGDMGSTVLGLLAGLLSLLGWQRELFPLWVPAILFSPFWVDATYTVLKRMYGRQRFWLPHRGHFYQRLVLSGLGHRRVVLLEYALMLLCSLSILLPLWVGLGYNLVVPWAWVLIYLIGLSLLEKILEKSRPG